MSRLFFARPLAAGVLALCLALPLTGCNAKDWLGKDRLLPPHLAALVGLADPAGPEEKPEKPGKAEKPDKPEKPEKDPKPDKAEPAAPAGPAEKPTP